MCAVKRDLQFVRCVAGVIGSELFLETTFIDRWVCASDAVDGVDCVCGVELRVCGGWEGFGGRVCGAVG